MRYAVSFVLGVLCMAAGCFWIWTYAGKPPAQP